MKQEIAYQLKRWTTILFLAIAAAWPIASAAIDWPGQSRRVRIAFAVMSFSLTFIGLIAAQIVNERRLSAAYQQALFGVVTEALHMRLQAIKPNIPDYRVCVLTAGYRFRVGQDAGFPIRYGRTAKIVVAEGDYKDEELRLQYPSGRWVYGKVLENNQPVLYERGPTHDQYLPVSKRYQEATERIHSAVAVQFYRPGDKEQKRPVGVFSIDCSYDCEHSGLHELAISRAVMDAAKHCGIFIR